MSSHTPAEPPSTPSANDPQAASAWIALEGFGEADIGGRKHMEDVMGMHVQRKGTGQVFLAVFDGHGGKEAAHFAKNELWSNMSAIDGFNSSDSEAVKKAISQGFQDTHHQMWRVRPSWKRRKDGTLSTAGTTASVVIVRQDRLFVANVGDSTVVLGSDPNFSEGCDAAVLDSCKATTSSLAEDKAASIKAVVLTNDHKPESEKETRRIEQIGGRVVMSLNKEMAVTYPWLPKENSAFESPSSLNPDDHEVWPALNIARSLGDLWSYSEQHNDYVVSPVPDVSEYKLITHRDKFVVLASDGLWNAMSPQEVVEFVHMFRQKELIENPHMGSSKVVRALIVKALEGWRNKCQSADNISVMIVFFRAN